MALQQDIRRAQKESVLLREISQLFLRITLDDTSLHGLSISKVHLSPNKSVCNVLFYIEGGIEVFKEKLSRLILYKPSMRSSLAKSLQSRHTPNLVFKYDSLFEKQQQMDCLLDSLNINLEKEEPS